MKKILLTILIIIVALSVNVIAVDIDIGSPAIDRTDGLTGLRTVVNEDNPANGAGIITKVEVWAEAEMTNVEIGIFYVVSGDNLSTRSWEAVVGSLPIGFNEIEVNLECQAGDYIGIKYQTGSIDRHKEGYAGIWHKQLDLIPCENEPFTSLSGDTVSLYGTSAVVGWDHKWNTKTISKWNTKEFIKWNGLE